jgi:alpha-L-fucosidase
MTMERISRRRLMQMMGGAAAAAAAVATTPKLFAMGGAELTLTKGPYQGTRPSLANYQMPEWFGKAKFGIWAHWGPQSAIEQGDWYARNMYIQDSRQYKYHVATYGHPSKVGYKDLVPNFKAATWDPDHLMDLYVKAGAKYFFSMGVHHDNFDMWNSKYQPRWNAVATGPKKDIVSIWGAAARKRGLKFGVSEHLSNSFDWLYPAHTSDKTGELAGVSYDGVNPVFADLYHRYDDVSAADIAKFASMGRTAPDRWKQQYFNRVKDLVDQAQPDLLYTDGGIPFEEYGLGTVAELYNVSELRNHKNQAIYFSKTDKDCAVGTCTLDRERGVLDAIHPAPWQTDTCIGNWHYQKGATYKKPKKVIDLLVDIVSKNGNLLLNIPLPNSGTPDDQELAVLAGITEWMQLNGEGIFETTPWKVYGDGPSTKAAVGGGGFNEGKKPDLGVDDVRYVQKGGAVYAFAMGAPTGEFVLPSLGTASAAQPGKVAKVEMLGTGQKLSFEQKADGLHVKAPGRGPSEAAAAIGTGMKVVLA